MIIMIAVMMLAIRMMIIFRNATDSVTYQPTGGEVVRSESASKSQKMKTMFDIEILMAMMMIMKNTGHVKKPQILLTIV